MRRTRELSDKGMRIKIGLINSGMTGKELALKINKSEATICDVMSGKNQSEETWRLILSALDQTE